MKYYDKEARIIDLARNKQVLHLGCVGFTDLKTSERVKLEKESLHFTLTEVASTTGIDNSRDAIDYLLEHGVFQNIVYGNVEKLHDVNIAETFNVIVAGDIIEHLSNPGLMLEGIKRFCNNSSLVIITTPHAFGVLNFLRFVFNKFIEGNEHVISLNSNIHNLLARHGYIIDSVDTCYQKNASKNAFFNIGRLFFTLFPRLGGTLFIVAKPGRIKGFSGRLQ